MDHSPRLRETPVACRVRVWYGSGTLKRSDRWEGGLFDKTEWKKRWFISLRDDFRELFNGGSEGSLGGSLRSRQVWHECRGNRSVLLSYCSIISDCYIDKYNYSVLKNFERFLFWHVHVSDDPSGTCSKERVSGICTILRDLWDLHTPMRKEENNRWLQRAAEGATSEPRLE